MKRFILLLAIILNLGFVISCNSENASDRPTLVSETISPENTDEAIKLELLSQSIREMSIDGFRIRGEIKNSGNVDAYNPKINTTLLSNGQVVAVGDDLGVIKKISPGMVVPYTIQIDNPPAYDDIKIEITADKKPSFGNYEFLTVLSQNTRESNSGGLLIAGELENTTEKKFRNIEITVWLLDANGNVIDIEDRTIDPMEPNSKQPYQIEFLSMDTEGYKTFKILCLGNS